MRHRAHGKMHKSVDVLKLQMELGRRHRRLLPEGLRGRGLRPRRHQGHPGLQPGPRPGQDRPARPDAEATAAASSSASTTSPTSPTSRRPRRSTAPTLDCLRRDRLRRRPLRRDHDRGRGRDRQGDRRGARACSFLGIQAYQGAMQHLDRLRGPQGQARRRHRPGQGRRRGAEGRGPRARARLRRRHRQLLFRERLRRLQRAAVRQLRLHGRRLRPHPRQGRQAHRPGRMGERALHPDQRDEPRQARQGDLRRRPQGAVGRLRPPLHLRPRRREVHQVLRRARRHRGPGRRPEGQREAASSSPATATRPATSTTGTSACATARSSRSGRSAPAARPTDPPAPRLRRARLQASYGLETWRAVVFRQQTENQQRNHARTCAHLMAATAARGASRARQEPGARP